MEKFIIFDNGISSLNLAANYKELEMGKYGESPEDCFILNNNKTMSVLKHVKNSERYEHLWTLSLSLDKKINGRLSVKVFSLNAWCSKCGSDVKSYSFDQDYNLYKAVGMGSMIRCISCTDKTVKFCNHTRFIDKYTFTKYGNNYVHQSYLPSKQETIYTILTEDRYTILKFNTYIIKYHPELTREPKKEEVKIQCTVCGIKDVAYWEHNKTCINNINKFAIQVYSKNNLLIRSLDYIPDDIKNLLTNDLISLFKY